MSKQENLQQKSASSNPFLGFPLLFSRLKDCICVACQFRFQQTLDEDDSEEESESAEICPECGSSYVVFLPE